jgi:hypothetical protein
MTTRVKFDCIEKRQYKGWNGHDFFYGYKFQVVVGNSEEDKKFFGSTPSGNLEISAVADNLFEPGKAYYLDFTPADDALSNG